MIASMRTPLMHRFAGDDVLAARAGGGDDLAFATLVRRVQPRLLAYCATILGNTQDADDAVQNTFIKALAGLRGGDQVRAVHPWLYRIAHNEAISLMRRHRPAAELVATVPDHAHGPEETVAVREEVRAVLHAIGDLPDRARDAFLLREVGGMRHAEVAQALGTSTGSARQAVFEARVALQDDRAGRDASCQAIRQEISARERRRASRTVRGHLRSCRSCRDWSDAQGTRRRVLGLAPLAGAGGLWSWLAGLAGGGAVTGGATMKIVASIAAVATVAPVGVGTLERELGRRADESATARADARSTALPATRTAAAPAATPAPDASATLSTTPASAPTPTPAPTVRHQGTSGPAAPVTPERERISSQHRHSDGRRPRVRAPATTAPAAPVVDRAPAQDVSWRHSGAVPYRHGRHAERKVPERDRSRPAVTQERAAPAEDESTQPAPAPLEAPAKTDTQQAAPAPDPVTATTPVPAATTEGAGTSTIDAR